MDYKRLEIAKKKFDIGQKLGYYNIVDLWIAVNEIFDALLDPLEADGSIDRATDGRITAEPGWKEGDSYFGAGTPNSLGAQRRMKERVVNNIEQERSPNYLKNIDYVEKNYPGFLNFGAGTPNSLGASARKVAAIMADGCDPDPADDGPEINILRRR